MSRRYQELRWGVGKLRKALLPKTLSPTGSYRNAEVTHLRAASFRILCHAEIEHYLEDVAFELYQSAWMLWKDHEWPSHTLTCLLGFSDVATSRPPKDLAKKQGASYSDIAVPLDKANNSWLRTHQNNHGVKEENVLGLFLPIGIPGSELDQTLLNDLNSFGARRGEVAHSSPTSVKTFLDPLSERDMVMSLVAALKPLDQRIESELKTLRRIRKRLANSP